MEREILEALTGALQRLFPGAIEGTAVEIETPREKGHGDFSTNIALTLARGLRKPPRAIADTLAEELARRDDLFSGVEVAGPGLRSTLSDGKNSRGWTIGSK